MISIVYILGPYLNECSGQQPIVLTSEDEGDDISVEKTNFYANKANSISSCTSSSLNITLNQTLNNNTNLRDDPCKPDQSFTGNCLANQVNWVNQPSQLTPANWLPTWGLGLIGGQLVRS